MTWYQDDPGIRVRIMAPYRVRIMASSLTGYIGYQLKTVPVAVAAKSLQSCATPQTAAHQAPRPWDSPGKSTGVGCHFLLQCMKGKWKWSCSVVLTLSDPMDCSPPGSSIHGIFQARVLEWGAIAFFHNGIRLKHKKRTKQCHLHQHGCI